MAGAAGGAGAGAAAGGAALSSGGGGGGFDLSSLLGSMGGGGGGGGGGGNIIERVMGLAGGGGGGGNPFEAVGASAGPSAEENAVNSVMDQVLANTKKKRGGIDIPKDEDVPAPFNSSPAAIIGGPDVTGAGLSAQAPGGMLQQIVAALMSQRRARV